MRQALQGASRSFPRLSPGGGRTERKKAPGCLPRCQDDKGGGLISQRVPDGSFVAGDQILRWTRAGQHHDHDGTGGQAQDAA